MTQRVADQHELLNRWREIADDLAAALEGHTCCRVACCGCEDALRRYEEASKA